MIFDNNGIKRKVARIRNTKNIISITKLALPYNEYRYTYKTYNDLRLAVESQDKDIIYQDDQDIKSDYNNNTTVYRKLKNISERQKYNLYKNINQQKLDNIDYYTESLKGRIINEGGSQYGISKERCKKMSKV